MDNKKYITGCQLNGRHSVYRIIDSKCFMDHYVYPSGGILWFDNTDSLHRIDGPAVEWPGGINEWFIEGREYTLNDWLRLSSLSAEEKVIMKLRYG